MTDFDIKEADDFKSTSKPAKNLIYCGHVQALLATSKRVSIDADCLQEIKSKL